MKIFLLAYCFVWSSLLLGQGKIQWISPDLDELNDDNLMSTSKLTIPIKLKILGIDNLKSNYISIYVDGKAGNKAGEARLMGKRLNIFKSNLQLLPGKHEYWVSYKMNNGTQIKSQSLWVDSGGKPKLHILSIGTDPGNLNYTSKDAEDFANSFSKQAGVNALFESVDIKYLLGKEATKDNIGRGIEALVNDFEVYNKIGNLDFVIVFISTHGFIENGSVYLQGDDYISTSPITRSIKYDFIIEQLSKIKCKKLVFMDACHSGGVGGKKSTQALVGAMQKLQIYNDGLTVIASSRGAEYSYEDDVWKHGAFTFSILEALRGEADSNSDKIISLKELYDYIEKKVPIYVENIKDKPQHPVRLANDLDDMPVFYTPDFNNKPREKPKVNLDDLAWEKAKKIHTLESYNTYLKDYPRGKHVSHARNKILEIKAKEVQPEWAMPIQQLVDNMISIPSGRYTMGCISGDCNKNEIPAHNVKINSFKIGKYEVTQLQWKTIMGRNPSKHICDECPVEGISWIDIRKFIKKLNTRTGLKFRLPTESEWEYAAKAGSSSKYSGGDEIAEVAWFGRNSGRKTHEVGKKYENDFGLFDMTGNVWEWCQDGWFDNYKNGPITEMPRASGDNSHVIRGGGFRYNDMQNRVTARMKSIASKRSNAVGFRLVLD